jgi:hypothetical protein
MFRLSFSRGIILGVPSVIYFTSNHNVDKKIAFHTEEKQLKQRKNISSRTAKNPIFGELQ